MKENYQNIFLIVLDTVRAKSLSAYGYSRETTPFLDKFEDDSIKYEKAFAPAPWTTPSHASFFTGSYGVAHQTNRSKENLTPDLPTLAEILNNRGYHTIAFSNNAHVSPRFDFDRGFDYFKFNLESYNEPFDDAVTISEIRRHTGDGPFHREALNALRYAWDEEGSLPKTVFNWLYRKASEADIVSNHDRGADSTNRFVERYLKENGEEPFFMFLNYMEAHAPYQAPDEYQYAYTEDPQVSGWENAQDRYFNQSVDEQERKLSDLLDQYDGCIRYLDSKMEELIEIIEDSGVLDNSIIILTSDHGEGFGEKGIYEHKIGVYDEVAHVPLWIYSPDIGDGAVKEPVSTRWILPTILRQLDIEIPPHVRSEDLLSPSTREVVIESEGLPYEYSDSEINFPARFYSPHQGYIDSDKEMKMIRYQEDDFTELYHIDDELEEVQREKEDVEELIKNLDDILERYELEHRSDLHEDHEVSEEIQAHLRDLGYQ